LGPQAPKSSLSGRLAGLTCVVSRNASCRAPIFTAITSNSRSRLSWPTYCHAGDGPGCCYCPALPPANSESATGELCSTDATVSSASVSRCPPRLLMKRAAAGPGWIYQYYIIAPDGGVSLQIGCATPASMRGRAAPTPLAETGRLLITADHGKPRHREQAHSLAPRPASTSSGLSLAARHGGGRRAWRWRPARYFLRAGLTKPMSPRYEGKPRRLSPRCHADAGSPP
jgi:hypothetical protein